MKKQKIATVVTCCALVGAIAVGGTLALLSAPSKTLNNTFTVGAGYPEDGSGLTIEEHAIERVTDSNLTAHVGWNVGDYAPTTDTVDGSEGKTGNTYSEVIAESTLSKDPNFTLKKGSPKSWIIAEVDGVSDLTSVGITVDTTTLSDKWYFVEKPSEENDNKYVLSDTNMKEDGTLKDGYYLYKLDATGKVDPTERDVVTDTLFTKMNVSATPTATSGNGLPLTVKGVAVQATDGMTLDNSLQTVMTKVDNVLHPAP